MTPAVRRLLGLALAGMSLWFAVAFHAAGHFYDAPSQPYSGWWMSQSEGDRLPPTELIFDIWYVAYGLCCVLCVVGALHLLGLTAPLLRLLRRLSREPQLPLALCLLIVLGSLLFRRLVLLDQVVTVDEQSYVFIAQTLLHGRVINPIPPGAGFFENYHVVLNDHGWFGKYPIGHPILLALALLLHLQNGLFALLGGVTAWLTWRLGRRTIGPRRALVALALLALSPHFVWTYGTLLSETTTTFLAVAAMLSLLQADRRGARWLLLAGVLLGFGFLARPLPGGLFVIVAALSVGWSHRHELAIAARRLAILGGPVALAVLALLAVNWIQTGSPFHTGYQEYDKSLNLLGDKRGQMGQSLVGAMLRENFWLFGWPLSLALLPFARPRRARLLLWGPVVASLVYRIAVPKTFVSATGPLYMTEAVPFLALLTADGLGRLAQLTRRLPAERLLRGLRVTVPVAGTVAALLCFLPPQLATLSAGAREYHRLAEAIDATGEKRGVVFLNIQMEHPHFWWVSSPPPPSPDLSDDWLFLRWPEGEKNALDLVTAYWKSHWPDRPAYLFNAASRPPLIPLQ